MPEDAVIEILKDIQKRIGKIEARLDALRTEMDGQFQLMLGRSNQWEGLARVVAEQGKRITALERAK